MKIRICSTGAYLPKKKVSAQEMDQWLGTAPGWVAKKSGVLNRHFVKDETASFMAAQAVNQALEKAGLKFKDIDALISTSGTMEQPIPCNAALIQRALGQENSGTPCFDINSTCLSFMVGLDTMSYMLEAGRFKRIVLVASEVASVGLNPKQKESAALMGDGACAVIIEKGDSSQTGKILASRMETYSSGAEFARIKAGGTATTVLQEEVPTEDYQFFMDGRQIFRMASKLLPDFCQRLTGSLGLTPSDLSLVIPHQASEMALKIIRGKLNVSPERFMMYVHECGNMIAASLPMGLHKAIESNKLKRGDQFMFLGTSAGFSLGAMVLEY